MAKMMSIKSESSITLKQPMISLRLFEKPGDIEPI